MKRIKFSRILGYKRITQMPAKRPDLVMIDKKKRNFHLVNFRILADHRVKIKENEKLDKYLDLARELKKLWNMKITVMQMIAGSQGTVFQGLEKRPAEFEIRGRIESNLTTILLRSARILRKVLETKIDSLSLTIYTHIYIYVCVCVCVCIVSDSVWVNRVSIPATGS